MSKKSAVIIGVSGGIGRALADALEEEDDFQQVIRLSRSENSPISIDLSDETTISKAAEWMRDRDIAPHLVIVATGLLHKDGLAPEKSIRELNTDWLMQNYQVNAIGPALVAKYFLPLMAQEGVAKFAALSARVSSISDNRLGGWYGYRASKAALNMMIRNLAIEWSRKNKRSVIVGLHPGTVDTPLSKPFQSNVPSGKLFDTERAALHLLDVLDGLKPGDSGKLFAWDGEEIAP